MRAEQFKAIYDQVAPAVMELFNQNGGMQPMMLWVKLDHADDSKVAAAGQVAEQAAMTRLFKQGLAQDMMPVMVRDLLDSAQVPDELGGGGINGVVVVGETTVASQSGDAGASKEGLGVWVHSRDRTECAVLPVGAEGGKRVCSWVEMIVSEQGRHGRLTMCPQG